MAHRRLIPFPFPMNIGTDICHIPRVESILNKNKTSAARFIRRIMAEEELVNPRKHIRDILREPPPREKEYTCMTTTSLREAGRFMAGRFAAKEAIIKAHPHLRLTFHDVIIKSPGDATSTDGVGEQERDQEGGLLRPRSLEPNAGDKDATVIDRDNGSGAPTAIIKGEEYDQAALISISHDGDYATAVCLGFRHEGAGGGDAKREGGLGRGG